MADSGKSEHDRGKGRKNAKKKNAPKPSEDKMAKNTTQETSEDKEDRIPEKTVDDSSNVKTEIEKNSEQNADEEIAAVPEVTESVKESCVVDSSGDLTKKPADNVSTEENESANKVAETEDSPKESTDKDLKDKEESSETVNDTPKSQDIPRSAQSCHTAQQDKVLDDLSDMGKESGGWGWGKSLLKTASVSVTTFTQHVGEGLTTFVETIESGLGAPPPEALVEGNSVPWDTKGTDNEAHPATEQPHKKEATKPSETDATSSNEKTAENPEEKETSEGSSGWLSGWGVGSLTSKIQNTGKTLISGSLDAVEAVATGGLNVLETIGKKTIDVLNEHDPEFKRTKNVLFLKKDKTNLSQLLREAKDQAEQKAQYDQEAEEARKANFGAMFDEFQGLAHLEALEILSNQSEKKVQVLLAAMSDQNVAALKPQLVKMKKTFELEDNDDEDQQEHEFSKLVTEHLSELHLGTTPDKINRVQENIRKWITDFYTKDEAGNKTESKEIHQFAIQSLAEITAKAVEQFHKAGELLLLQKDSEKSCYDRAKSLASFTRVLCTEIGILSTKFSQCLNKASEDTEDSSVVTPMVTNVFLEASNSSTYIQDAFCLLLPVLQQAEIQNSQTSS